MNKVTSVPSLCTSTLHAFHRLFSSFRVGPINFVYHPATDYVFLFSSLFLCHSQKHLPIGTSLAVNVPCPYLFPFLTVSNIFLLPFNLSRTSCNLSLSVQLIFQSFSNLHFISASNPLPSFILKV